MRDLERLLASIDPPLDIRREGRAWSDEARARWEQLTPEKIEMIEGRLLWEQGDRIKLLAALLENVGADLAVRLGDPAVWRDALANLSTDRARGALVAGGVRIIPRPSKKVREALGEDVVDELMEWIIGVLNRG